MDYDHILDFLKNDFDEKKFVSRVLGKENLSNILEIVSGRLSDLDASICAYVSEHNTELLNQTFELDKFTHLISSIESRIQGLSNDVDKMKNRLAKPYESLSTQVIQTRRLALLCEVLRKTHCISGCVHRLRNAPNDLAKMSQQLGELEYLFKTIDWNGITVLEEYHAFSIEQRNNLESSAWKLIHSSFDFMDQVNLAAGLQVFDNLTMLPTVIGVLLTDWQKQFEVSVTAAIDTDDFLKRSRLKVSPPKNGSTPGRASLPSSGAQEAVFRSFLWTGVDQMLKELERFVSCTHLLGITLKKKRSGHSGNLYGDQERFQSQPPTLADRLVLHASHNWSNAAEEENCAAIVLALASLNSPCNTISDDYIPGFHSCESSTAFKSFLSELASSTGFFGWASTFMQSIFELAVKRSRHLKEAFEGEYPRLLKLFLEVLRKTSSSPLSGGNRSPLVPANRLYLPSHVQKLLMPFENAYLARILSLLFDRVGSVFLVVGDSLPEYSDIDELVRIAASELSRASLHYDLLCKVARNISKMVDLFGTKVEALVFTDSAATQVTDPPTLGQKVNTRLVNLICHFGRSLQLAVSRSLRGFCPSKVDTTHADEEKSALNPAVIVESALVNRLNSLCKLILEPLLLSIVKSCDEILFKMHSEFSQSLETPDNNTSAYIQDLHKFLLRIRNDFISQFSQPSGVSDLNYRQAAASKDFYSFGLLAIQDCLRGHLSHIIDAFIVNASLVRPCSQDVLQRLATNCSELELAVDQLTSAAIPGCRLIDLAPQAYAQLHAFRPLLLTSTDDIFMTFSTKDDAGIFSPCLSSSLLLHHLLSRAPEEIPSPYTASNWSLARYVRWFLQPSTDELTRLDFIKQALAVYTEDVEARKQKQYAETFPAIRDLLERCQSRLITSK